MKFTRKSLMETLRMKAESEAPLRKREATRIVHQHLAEETEDELTKVRELLQSKAPYIRPSVAEMIVEARFDREIIVEAVREDDEVEKRRAQSVADSRAAEAIKPKRGKKAR